MAASVLPQPGTKLGPCKRCEHIDCKETRQMAETLCAYCQQRIAYSTRFYRLPSSSLVHAHCHESADNPKE